MAQMSSRRSAAESILKQMGGGKELPPIEDEELAPVDEEMPAEMPPMPEEAMGGEMPPPEESPEMDLDAALAGVEGAIDGLPEDAVKEVRVHLEAIREIVASGGGGEQPPPPPGAEAPEVEGMTPPEAPDSGMEKLPL